jgi:hypothetical protein
MALLENLRKTVAEAIYTPNPNRGAERATAQPLPAVDYTPVNIPGSRQPLIQNAWYRLVAVDGHEVGMAFLCRCGVANRYMFGKYDLRRELEHDHNCSARCVHVVEKKRAENGEPAIMEQVRLVDDKGLPLGALHSLLNLLPEQGKRMSERERDKVYATLPTWQISNGGAAAQPYQSTWNDQDVDPWQGKAPQGSDGSWV